MKNKQRVVFHSTNTELDGVGGIVVGKVTTYPTNMKGNIYVVKPDTQYGEYDSVCMTDSCLQIKN